MRRRMMFALVFCAAMFALVAAPGLSRAQGASQEVSVTLTEFSITPNSITVTQGQPVHFTLTNSGKFPHTLSFKNGDTVMNVTAQPVAAGQSGSGDLTFNVAGMWQMYCPVDSHASKGMTGQAMVVAPAAPGMPATGQTSNSTLYLAVGLASLLVASGLFARSRRHQA